MKGGPATSQGTRTRAAFARALGGVVAAGAVSSCVVSLGQTSDSVPSWYASTPAGSPQGDDASDSGPSHALDGSGVGVVDASDDGPPAAGDAGDAAYGWDAADSGTATPDAGDASTGGGCTLTSCGTRETCVGGQCVLSRRVFVSSSTYTGNLGGYAGADATCQQLANAAGLGGKWMAWVSDGSSSPSTRFDQASYAYRLLDGTVVASDWSALVSGTLAHGIDLDEGGNHVSGTTEVWTATNPDGTLLTSGCNDFTSGAHGAQTATVGVSGDTDARWTVVYLQFCDRSDHLYCFEQ